MQIIACGERVEELVQFVARLNSDGRHHIGFFGEGEAEVRASLGECLIPPLEGFMLAYDSGRLVGVFGVDADPEISRAWMFGPLVDHPEWDDVADELYRQILPLIPAGIRGQDMFCDVVNTRLQAFATRHEFPLHSENAVLVLRRDRYRPPAGIASRIIPFEERFFGPLEALHKTLFTNAYYTARQMVEKRDDSHQLLLAVDDSRLLGYHFCKIEAESGYIDFIGTDEAARGRGIGADLLVSGIDWMLGAPSTQKINLTGNADNVAARRLYEKIGFETDRVMRGYRKKLEED